MSANRRLPNQQNPNQSKQKVGTLMPEVTGTIFLPDRILARGKVVYENGKILEITPLPPDSSAADQYILPGLIDIHNHGAMCHDYMEASEDAFTKIADHLTAHGITTAQCTTVSAPVEQIRKFISFFRHWSQSQPTPPVRCRFSGIHIEGPYIAPEAKGAHPLETLLTPAKDGYDWILENADVIREVTVAPELPGMENMIRDLRTAGIVVSGGHDHSEPEDVERAIESGMTHCTHIYCAMSTLHKTNGHRRCGLTEYAMTSDRLTAEIIADNHHVPPLLAKMVHKAKGPEGMCIVSDAIAPGGLPESKEVYRLGTGEDCTRVIVEGGVAMVEDRSCYAGSVQSLDLMIGNLVRDAGIPLHDAVTMATLTPARIIGIDGDCGSIEIGKRADFCIMDKQLNVLETIVEGHSAYTRK